LVTPDEENAGGIVSFVSHAPFANAKKSVHAFTVLSTYEGSNTFSAGRFAGLAGVCAFRGNATENVSAVRRSGGFRIELIFGEGSGHTRVISNRNEYTVKKL
jgi:hypothetical protein